MTIIPGFTSRAHARHFACMYDPEIYDDYYDRGEGQALQYSRRIEIVDSIYRTPQAVLAANFAKQWQLDMELSYGGASIAEEALLIDMQAASPPTSTGSLADLVALPTTYTRTETVGEDYITCQISINEFSSAAFWCKQREAWTVPLRILILCGTSPEDPEETPLQGRFALGEFSTQYQSQIETVDVTFCGLGTKVFENRADGSEDIPADAFPAGAITLKPKQWLEW